jgi:signal transduction histidine kinase
MLLFRHQADPSPLPKCLVDLPGLLRSEANRVGARVPGRSVELRLGAAEVQCDEPSLRQALGVVLERALARTATGGKVRVETEPEPEWCAVRVIDDGPSLGPGGTDSYFQLFVVADVDHHSRKVDLDLPIAASIVERHGGSIVAKEPPNGGLVCEIRLPRTNGKCDQGEAA